MGLFVSVNADPTWCLESVTQLGVEDFHGNRGLLLSSTGIRFLNISLSSPRQTQ
jgi:hypothetical protein